MKYIIMMTVTLGLAAADMVTGFIKAYCLGEIQSSKMRRGGMNKLCELVVMSASAWLEAGVRLLGGYYETAKAAEMFAPALSAVVFGYIVLMELVSILENYASINPDAGWVTELIKRLRDKDRR